MTTSVRLFLVAGAATVLLVVVGLLVFGGEEETDPVTTPSIPLAEYDTSTVAVQRASFCDAVDPDRITEALGDREASATAVWGSGDAAPEGTGSAAGDVVAEHGCTWTVDGGRTASAWVFAPPVTTDRAAALVQAANATPGCTAIEGAPAFGTPSTGLVCDRGDAGVEVSYRGLFGDAWLVCTLTGPAAESRTALTDAAGRWCVAVADAAAQTGD